MPDSLFNEVDQAEKPLVMEYIKIISKIMAKNILNLII